MTVSPLPADADRSTRITRELLLALMLAWILVIARSAVYVIYEQSFFDSDQAILGLMAKHLAEGRAFPLFFYGQGYLLGVDAWLAAPWFLIAGSSVATLHASLMLTNLVVATLLIVGLHRADRMRPLVALVAVLPFAFAPPLTATYLLDAAATLAPFLYVCVLWMLRDRPLWFGSVLTIGFLHREFTLYAVPVLLVLEAWDGSLWRRARMRAWGLSAVAAVVTWQVVQALKPVADFMGPGTRGQLLRGYDSSQFDNLTGRTAFVLAELPERLFVMVREHLPRLVGATVAQSPVASQGHAWLYWPLVIGLTGGVLRAVWLIMKNRERVSSSFATYLLGVGFMAAAGYIITRPADQVIDRYLLLVVLVPVGMVGLLLAFETRAWIRWSALGLMGFLCFGSAADHVRLARRYAAGHEPNDLRVLGEALAERGVRITTAGYWRAYKLTFIMNERVKVASTDFVRIDEYQELANAEGDQLLTLEDQRCLGGEAIHGWFLCRLR